MRRLRRKAARRLYELAARIYPEAINTDQLTIQGSGDKGYSLKGGLHSGGVILEEGSGKPGLSFVDMTFCVGLLDPSRLGANIPGLDHAGAIFIMPSDAFFSDGAYRL